MTKNIEEALSYIPPSRESFANTFKSMNAYFSPEFFDLENINPDKPTLFVGKHGRYGAPDTLLLVNGLYQHTGAFSRGLADFIHYEAPWRNLIGKYGGVVGTRDTCRTVMEKGDNLLVYPRGGREAFKNKASNYQLSWERRLGFVRMAIETGHTITPVACAGNEALFEVFTTVEKLLGNPLGRNIKEKYFSGLMAQYETELPTPKDIGLSFVPKPVKLYYKIATPIETTPYAGESENTEVLLEVQDLVAQSLNNALKDVMLIRAQRQHNESKWRKLLTKF